MNYAELSDEELLNIANGDKKPKIDYSTLSDEELLNKVNGVRNISHPKIDTNPVDDEFNPNLEENPEHPYIDAAKGVLKGGIKATQDFTGALKAPVQNPNIAQGLGNITRDLGQFGVGLVQGVPQFLGDIKNQAVETGTNLQQNPNNWGAVMPAVAHGVDKALGDMVSGVLNLPESVAASYKGREVNPHFTSTAPLEFYRDKINELMFNKGLISQKQYEDYLKQKVISQQQQSQVPIAGTLGEFIPAMLPIGKAAGIIGGAGKTAQTAEKLSKAQQIAKTAKDIGKAGATGAGYGFVVNPEASLAERSQAAGSGTAAGALLGAGGKAIQASGKAAAPHIHNAAKKAAYAAGKGTRAVLDVTAEIRDRLNPNNYETVLDAQPVEKGTGLSQRTVYETKQKTIFKKPNNTKTAQNYGEAPKIAEYKPGTDFVMGEGSELKTPAKPQRTQKQLSVFEDSVSERTGALDNNVRNLKDEEHQKTIDKIKEIAPNTAEKIEEKQNRNIVTGLDENGNSQKYDVTDIKNIKKVEQIAPKTTNNIKEVKPNTKIKTQIGNSLFANDEYYSDGNFVAKRNNFELVGKNKETIDLDLNQSNRIWNKFKNDENTYKLEKTGRTWNGKQLKAVEYKYIDNNGEEKTVYLPKRYAEIINGYDLSYGIKSELPIIRASKNGELVAVAVTLPEKAAEDIKNNPDNFINVEEQKQARKEELQKKKELAGNRPTFKYIVKTDKYGNQTGSFWETEKYHTDGNASYLKEFVNADTSRVQKRNKDYTESVEKVLNDYFNAAEKYTVKLEELGKIHEIKDKKGKVKAKARIFEAEYDGQKVKYAINDKYLLDKKGYELYVDKEDNSKFKNLTTGTSAVSLRKDGKQIGIIMPIQIANSADFDSNLIPVNKMETSAPKSANNHSVETNERIKKLAPNIAKKQELAEQVEKATKQYKDNKFIPDEEKQVLIENLQGEEKEHFIKTAQKLEDIVNNAPGLYATDDIPLNDKKPVLHYFCGSYDNYVFEIDKETGEMFGAVSMDGGKDFELGYSSMDELNSFRSTYGGSYGDYKYMLPSVELDLYYDNTKTFGEVKNEGATHLEKGDKIVHNDSIEKGNDNGQSRSENTGTEGGRTRTEIETSKDNGRKDDAVGRSLQRNVGRRGQGLEPEHKNLIDKSYSNQHELNKEIEDFIKNKEYEKYQELPSELKEWLKKYAGAGGLEKQGAKGRGLLSEYYTPKNIVKKMWDLTSQYIKLDGSKVLEPSVGIGNFLEAAPKNIDVDVIEMNPISAKITELLYPEVNVKVGQFQERFIDKTNNKPVKSVTPEYDIIIGNPPYGQYSGIYKGLGEGKGIDKIETYFIKRGLDLLNENGIMTFIVPSSFLNSEMNAAKLEISQNAKILDAYRLPENMFDTTSIGTDIIVLRKTKNTDERSNFYKGGWFENNPDKILGEVLERKNKFGKIEKYVKGTKEAIDNIQADKRDIQETIRSNTKKEVTRKTVKPSATTTKKTPKVEDKNIAKNFEEYKPEIKLSDEEFKYYADTRVDGTLPKDKYKPGENVNQYKGELYNDFNYLNGDIYEKLDALENEHISDKQKEIQRKKLLKVLPKPKKLSEISLTPTSDFVKDFSVIRKVKHYNAAVAVDEEQPIAKLYKEYLRGLTNSERNGISVQDLQDFVDGKAVRTHYKGNPTKEEKVNQKIEFLTKLKSTADKLFNDFVITELSAEEIAKLENLWNRNFNGTYTPDFKKLPMRVRGLSANFYGDPLKLQDVQVEGINYLSNQGVGLLGFEVGVGKTLSGTIATIQNMQLGRCKRPLVLVPKSVKPNWIKEVREAFPNIKINDLDNLSKFNGKIEDGSLSIATYQALDNLWYNDDTLEMLKRNTKNVRTDIEKEINSTERYREKSNEKNDEFIGKALAGNKQLFKIEDLGFDHITVDEAHNFKNLFGSAKAEHQDGNAYSNISGAESTRAKRLFLATQYILEKNNNRNVFMLTATPFNNSPLEVFNMLSYIAKDKLDKMGIYNVYQFMENYVDVAADWVVNSKNEVSYKQIAKGFKNLKSLQGIIDTCMLMRTAEDAGIIRPNKVTKQFALNPTDKQKKLIAQTESLAVGIEMQEDGSIRVLDKEELKGIQLKAISMGRVATLSPDIFEKNYEVTPEDFIKNSPKLDFIMRAVEKMKKKDPTTSQLIYMPLGVEFLPKIKQYFINKGIYKAKEIEIIKGGISDDKISAISDSFNDPKGDIKLIIGTNKIKEGMNLNKNSSVLYVPFIDWNPTDYVQVVGRIWRRGNKYKNIRIVIPTLNDSADSFMYQKLDEKTSRINNLMDRGKDYIDTGELNAAEEKINMITNPEKKARMFSQIEEQKLNQQESNIIGQIEDTKHYLNELRRAENAIKTAEDGIERTTKTLSTIEDKESWQYRSNKNYLESYKKDLNTSKKHLENLNKRIERLELDLEGKDSVENLTEKLNDVRKQKENLKETTALKLEEYKKEYEKNKITGKSIEDYVAEFDNDTTNGNFLDLYDAESSVDIPDFLKNKNKIDTGYKDLNLTPLYENISKGIKGEDLIGLLPRDIGDIIEEYAKNYTFGEMITDNRKKKGLHQGKKATILLNLDAIGNNPYMFVETLTHEVRHATQRKLYLQIKSKPKQKWTSAERDFIKNYDICKEVNKDVRKYYNKHKELIDKYAPDNFYSAEERANAIFQLNEKEQNILKTYNKKFKKYWNSQLEVDARTEGAKNAKGYKTKSRISRLPRTKQANNGTRKKGYLVSVPRYSSKENSSKIRANGRGLERVDRKSQENEFSIEPGEYKQKEVKEAALDKVYKWHGNIGKDRFDVDKALNSFVNLTKGLGKEYSKKYGMNVTDKMVREVMPFLRERTELPKKLNRPDLKKFFDKLSGTEKSRLTDLADKVSAKFDKYYKNYEATNGVVDAEGIENHISHIWDLDSKKKSLLTNYFTTSSRFAKNRTIDTLIKGIDGFEVGGELIQFKPKTLDYAEILKTSSDNLIKATHDRILADEIKNLKYKGKPLVMASSKAPSDWVEISHPALNKSVYAGTTKDDNLILKKGTVKVHPDIAPQISAIFEVQKPDNAFWKGYDTINGMLKQSTLGFSGFHGYALTESAASNVGLKNTISELNIKKLYDSVKNGEYEVFKNEEIVKQAIEDGVEIGTPQCDTNRTQVERFLNRIPKIGKILLKTTETNNKILWDCLHTMYKVRAYEYLVNQEGGLENTTVQQRRDIAQWVNDSFGGQAWELLGIKRSAVKAAGRLLLSPDWNFSTIRQTMGLFGGKTLDNIITGKDNKFWDFVENTAEKLGAKGENSTGGIRGKAARAFFLRFIIYSAIGYNLINAAFRERDRKKHPELYPKNMRPIDYTIWANSLPNDKFFDKVFPYVFIGRNKDGSARYLRVGKQVREVPEMLSDPINKFGGKSASIINMMSQVALGMNPADIPKMITGNNEDVYYNQNIWKGYGRYAKRREGSDLVKGMGKTALKSAVPFVMNKALDEKHDTSAWDVFAQTSKGLTYGKTVRAFNQAYRKNQKGEIQKIGNRAYQDGVPKETIEAARKNALKKYRADNSLRFKHSYVEAMQEHNKNKVQQVTNEMKKRHLPSEEQKRIYDLAYKEYMKGKGR